LFDNWDKSFRHGDVRHVAINAGISDADDMAHKFHAMRDGVDKSVLPASITGSGHGNRGPGRSLSGLMREVRDEYLTPGERLREVDIAEAARDREQYRDTVRGFAQDYARMTGDPKAAALIHNYVQHRSPRLERECARRCAWQAMPAAAI